MLEGLQSLVDLSQVDVQLADRERERAAIPAKREACAEQRAQAEARLEAAREAVEQAELAQRRSEGEVREHEALLAKLEGQQHQVKTNEAYTALLHEMEQARRAISDAETRILEAMEAIEEAKRTLASGDRDLTAVRERLGQEHRALDERDEQLQKQIAELRQRRDQIAAGLDVKLLDRYERIAARRSPAVAVVTQELCMGCRLDIPPQNYIEIIKGEALITCEHCHRILIHEEQLGQSAAS
ncbi:MAG TPA: C4-type zinc ribbon domain-containing protein [Myxococcota bacterium]